jgi:uncharacterized protein
MFPVIPAQEALLIVGSMLIVVMTSSRLIQPEWWKARAVRAIVLVAFAGMFAGLGLWTVGNRLERFPLVLAGAGITYVGILVLAPAVLVLPLTAVVDRGLMFATRPRGPLAPGGAFDASARASKSTSTRTGLRLSRRGVIRAGAAALPVMAAATGASGFASAQRPPRMPVVRMRYEGLHPDLQGFRILHLSDLHLGACLGLVDLEKALEAALAVQRPDLIVLTGDLADDPSLMPGALELVARAAARHGAFASLGNHEYLHDILVTRPHYDASPIPLLVSSGRTLAVGRARLFVGGADDPVHMGGDIAGMVTPSIERAAALAPAHADFRMLLCHRPEGHGPAAANGFDLTLSGHTHGGQLGLFGRSLFEQLRPGTSWWGTYQRPRPDTAAARRSALVRSPSRLYTTSGFGHWFPFRLGCPTEMPLIVLEGGSPPEPSPARPV